jgi:hypothetical protein
MDAPGRNVAAFLEMLQDAMKRVSVIWGLYQLRGSRPGRPFLALSERPYKIHRSGVSRDYSGSLALGIPLEGADGRGYRLVVDVLWDAQGFTVTTEAWRDGEEGASLLREYPARAADDLEKCAREVKQAVEDLKTFDDLVPGDQSP